MSTHLDIRQRDSLLTAFLLLSLLLITNHAQAAESPAANGPFVFAYFNTGEAGESAGLQLAWSRDGAHWDKLTSPAGNFLKPEVGGKLLRDPSVVQGSDGTFHMVWTTDWWKHGIGLAHSQDLIHWSDQEYLDVMKDFPSTVNCWAPEIFYDAPSQTYVIYWASTLPGKYPASEATGEEFKSVGTRAAHRIYATTTQDFKSFTPTRLFYDDGYNVIDAFIVSDPVRKRYIMILKDETRYPDPMKNLRLAFSESPIGPWSASTPPFTPDWVEGPSVLKVNDEYWVYYDAYTRHRYEGQKTKDFERWEPITDILTMPPGMRHGTPFSVSEELLQKLLANQKPMPTK